MAAVRDDAGKYASVHFYLLGGGADSAKLTHVTASAGAVTSAVSDRIVQAAGQR